MKRLIINILLVSNLFLGSQPLAQDKSSQQDELIKYRARVLISNDFGGDPDGLFQLVHHLLSPSVEIRGIIASHIKPGGFFGAIESAEASVNEVNELLNVMESGKKFRVIKGSNSGLVNINTPILTEGAKAIVKEAMREDTDLPLYIACGGSLTDIASAYLMEPTIAQRLTLIWIGGPEYTDIALPPPGYTSVEYNLGIDIIAAQVIFNISDIPLWQVPRNTYRQALVSYSELILRVKPFGKTGKYLFDKMNDLIKETNNVHYFLGETYILGDNPLVLLTALQSPYDADPSSSKYVIKPAPIINDSGLYEVNFSGRNIRVYTNIDNRLMLEDFFSKLVLLNSSK